MSGFYKHWRQVPAAAWRWRSFRPQEIACRGDGSLLIDDEAMDKLQALRDRLGKAITINSGYRSGPHNKRVGGSPRSQHLLGKAFDIQLAGHDREALTQAALEVGFTGVGQYHSFIHVDTGPPRRWDERGKRGHD